VHALTIERVIAALIFASFAWTPYVNAQAPAGDFDRANNAVIHRADDLPVVHRLRAQRRGPGSHRLPSFFVDGNDYETAFRRAEWIGICEYLGYENRDQIDYFNSPIALFHTVKVLKGPSITMDMPINFTFYDKSDAQMPEGWHFTEDKMPPLKSQWLIFLPNAAPYVDHVFYTYNGSYGRQPAIEENISKVKAIIKVHNREAGLE
jgi:hypothetical protein